jgi:hypothetical protein
METMEITLSVTATVVAAWYGAIVATIGAFAHLANFLRDRAKVKVTFQRNMQILNDPRRQGMVFTLLTIVNSGRRPVTLTHVSFSYLERGGALLTDVSPRLPAQLTEGQEALAFVDEAITQFDRLKAFHARDAVGRTYTTPFASRRRRAYWFFRRLLGNLFHSGK